MYLNERLTLDQKVLYYMYKLIKQGQHMDNQLIRKLESLCDTKEEMAQLVLHEVLHVVWGVTNDSGMISRDSLTEEINRRFTLSARAQEL